MSHPPTTAGPEQVVRAVAAAVSRLVAGGLTDPERDDRLEALLGLYAESTDVRHPFAPTRSGAAPLTSRADSRVHFEAGIAALGEVESFVPVDATVHRTEDRKSSCSSSPTRS